MKKTTILAVVVAALGYFVDIYDLLLFSIVRVASLKDLGVAEDSLLSTGVFLINAQMAGLLLGGILWGILGDRRGRLTVLFGSIGLYSVGNILNAFVTSVEQYAVLRFFTGIGLAGELGAGITLVSELMPAKSRGYATTLIAAIGVSGAVVASLVGDFFHWRIAYGIGGVLGLTLLLLRVNVAESEIFKGLGGKGGSRRELWGVFGTAAGLRRYLSCIAIGVPIWFGIGILVTFAPEIGLAMGMDVAPSAGRAVLFAYSGLMLGDFASGLASQLVKSRRFVILASIIASALVMFQILRLNAPTAQELYWWIGVLGFFLGYWAVFITTAAEQFGTNVRATVTTTVPNFVRGSVIPMTLLLDYLKPTWGVLPAAQVVGMIVVGIAVIAGLNLKETYGRELDFVEPGGNQ